MDEIYTEGKACMRYNTEMRENWNAFLMRLKRGWSVWVGLAGMAVAGVLCGGAFLLVWLFTPGAAPPMAGGQAVITRLPAPTYTPVVVVTATPTPEDTGVDGIRQGSEVEIYDTGGSGLRFRSEPDIGAEIQFIAAEQEVFRVESGPVEEDGFVWWYLVSGQIPERRGWAVSTYLRLIEGE